MTDARVTTVQNILTHPGTERPWAGRTVSIRLNVPSFIDGGSVEKVGTSYATTDADGLWSVVLEVNDDIDPAGTYYSVREVNSGPLWTFIVPYSASPVTLRSCLVVDPSNPDPLVAGVQEIVAGANVTVDSTDPSRPVVSSTGGGGGGAVSSVFGRAGAVVAQSGDYSSFYDAAGSAGSAQSAAIAAAASDATTKANAAQAAAIAASDPAGAAATAQAAAIAASQPLDSDLTAIAALTTTTFGRSLLTEADASALRTAAGLGTAATHPATDFDTAGAAAAAQAASQPLDSDLTAIAALTTTTFGRSFLALADASAGRTLLGLGTLATQSGTFSGTSSGTNTGDQDLSALAPKASPALTGNPTAPTQAALDNSTKLATTAYADAKVEDAVTAGHHGVAPSGDAVATALASNLAAARSAVGIALIFGA